LKQSKSLNQSKPLPNLDTRSVQAKSQSLLAIVLYARTGPALLDSACRSPMFSASISRLYRPLMQLIQWRAKRFWIIKKKFFTPGK
jgi:hypothetical protein